MTRNPATRAIVGILAVYGVMVALVLGLRLTGLHLSLPLRLAFVLVVAVPISALIFRYWRSIDEAAREAQKWAWFWGGTFGMGVGLVATTVASAGLVSVFEGAPPAKLLAYGAMTVTFAQLAGFLAAWAYWWGVRR
jgi:hypothetical protein